MFRRDHPLKGNWRRDFFRNDNPIVLELGAARANTPWRWPNATRCAITSASTSRGPAWRGARTATDRKMPNVGFLRTRIEFINALFAEGEVAEIWITFPDPQLKTRRARKRLTSPVYLAYYAGLLQAGGAINLKTDSKHLYAYTAEVIRRFGLPCEVSEPDIYGTGRADEVLSIKTAYEERFLGMGLPITYTRFLARRPPRLPVVRLGGETTKRRRTAKPNGSSGNPAQTKTTHIPKYHGCKDRTRLERDPSLPNSRNPISPPLRSSCGRSTPRGASFPAAATFSGPSTNARSKS